MHLIIVEHATCTHAHELKALGNYTLKLVQVQGVNHSVGRIKRVTLPDSHLMKILTFSNMYIDHLISNC